MHEQPLVNRNKIEAAVLEGLREVLKDPGYWKHYLKVYNDERRQLAAERPGIAPSSKPELDKSNVRQSALWTLSREAPRPM